MTLSEFNELPKDEAISALYACCHCQTWAKRVAERRPFLSFEKLLTTAKCFWSGAEDEQILEAFSGHARIGDIELLRSRYAGHATQEQGQVLSASEVVIRELYRLNREYEAKNGFIFIVCASGKSAEEMLALLRSRIDNPRAVEMQNGAREQGEITRLRIATLIDTH